MPRLPEVPLGQAHPLAAQLYATLFGDRDPVTEPGTATGSPGNWWTVTAGVPELFDHITAGFSLFNDPTRVIDPKLRELAQTRAGYARGSRFVFSQHVKACRSAGISEEQIEAIPSWSVADCWSPTERAVLAYTDALVLEGGRVPDAVFDTLYAELQPEAILELTYITCSYDMHATISKALRLEFDDVDDRITEVPAPNAAIAAMTVADGQA
jgi:alkylhydroperoxidase family enzyme